MMLLSGFYEPSPILTLLLSRPNSGRDPSRAGSRVTRPAPRSPSLHNNNVGRRRGALAATEERLPTPSSRTLLA